MKRVCVIGPPGSGKSAVARAIGEATGLPVVHLDTLFWKPGWVESEHDEFEERVRELIACEEWVIDGNYAGTLPDRISRADMVVFLDLPRPLYLARIVKRRVMYARRARVDMTAGCPERIDLSFWAWARLWHRGSRARKYELLAGADPSKVRLLRSRAGVKAFVSTLRSAPR